MSPLVRRLDRSLYPDYGDNWDDELLRTEILSLLRPEHVILDLGAGAGIVKQMNFRGLAKRVCGVDPDARVLDNPFLDEARVATGESLPYGDSTFDIVFSDNVLEHVERPLEVLREIARVLRPDGYLLAKTPNSKHYMPLVARLTPHSFHTYFNALRGRSVEDTFPTRYRLNSISDIRRWANAAGMKLHWARLIEGRPEYLRVSAITYLLGWLYERIVNSSDLFRGFRLVLIVCLTRLDAGQSAGSGSQ
jgi:SAM-dependent methyltransferase